jgi:hypothetical protein
VNHRSQRQQKDKNSNKSGRQEPDQNYENEFGQLQLLLNMETLENCFNQRSGAYVMGIQGGSETAAEGSHLHGIK